MALAMKATVTTMSSKPCRFSSSTMCSIIGRLASGIIGLGWLEVSGPQPGALAAGHDHGLHRVRPTPASRPRAGSGPRASASRRDAGCTCSAAYQLRTRPGMAKHHAEDAGDVRRQPTVDVRRRGTAGRRTSGERSRLAGPGHVDPPGAHGGEHERRRPATSTSRTSTTPGEPDRAPSRRSGWRRRRRRTAAGRPTGSRILPSSTPGRSARAM